MPIIDIFQTILTILGFFSLISFLIFIVLMRRSYYSDDPQEYWENVCDKHPQIQQKNRLTPCKFCSCTCDKCICNHQEKRSFWLV